MRIAAIILMTAIVLPALSSPLPAEITQHVSRDGTIEYRNSRKAAASGTRHEFSSPHTALIETISQEENIDPYLVKCVIKVESNFNAGAVSTAGAMGLMQIMQDIARDYGVKDPFNPRENITAGVKHLKYLLAYFKGDTTLALAAYHAGAGRVKKHMAVPPIKSTVEYVNSVLRLYEKNEPGDVERKVRRLYRKISDEGTIEIYGK